MVTKITRTLHIDIGDGDGDGDGDGGGGLCNTNCPCLFRPQVQSSLVLEMAAEWKAPHETSTMVMGMALEMGMGMGSRHIFADVSMPS